MSLKIIDCEQNSLAWFNARKGLPTASGFKAILAKGEGKTRASYLRRLAAEIITGEPLESFSTPAMARGHDLEDEARDYFSFLMDVQPTRVGFIRNGRKGCSPDSLINSSELLEIKTQRGDLLIETILKDEVPSEHKAQIQGQLWVAEREVCHLLVYWPAMPPFIKSVHRDEKFINELSAAVSSFNADLDQLVERVGNYGVERKAAVLLSNYFTQETAEPEQFDLESAIRRREAV